MTDHTATLSIKSIDGATERLLVANAGTGYAIVSPIEPDEQMRHITVTSPLVDGTFITQTAADATRLELMIRCYGSSRSQVENRFEALKTALKASHTWLAVHTVDGVSRAYRAYRPDISSTLDSDAIVTGTRLVKVSIPVLPNPTVTGD